MKGRLKLGEALLLLGQAKEHSSVFLMTLVTGFTPEPLGRFLAAYLQRRLQRRIEISVGAFDSFSGNLERAVRGDQETAAVLEWADLDPRLGLRHSGAWGRSAADDVLDTVQSRCDLLATILEERPDGSEVVFVPPSLLPAPVVATPSHTKSSFEIALETLLARFLSRIAAIPRVRIEAVQALDIAPAERVDVKAWLQAGFPYRTTFASALAEQIAAAMCPAVPRKGLITDLDNTLWSGILGEAGVENVYWDLDHKAGHHGLYQRFVQGLAEDGVLIGIASKNDASLVEQALGRPDLLVKPDSIFPVEAHWQAKTESASRILSRWNIGPEAVVFVDDSPLELELMKATFPAMECIAFPPDDPDGVWALACQLRDLFGKRAFREEDALRTKSLRSAERFQAEVQASTAEDILRSCGGELTVARLGIPPDPRALELVNKTNQFNLNGVRYLEADWLRYLGEGTLAWILSYADKFGALGKIAVVAGRQCGKTFEIDVWVMSCRAFSRRIEHAVMESLFAVPSVEEIVLRYSKTERNGPIREFLEQISGHSVDGECAVSRALYDMQKPSSYMTVGVV